MTAAHKIGDRVVLDPELARGQHVGVVFVVKKINPKRTVCEPEGGGRGLTAPHDMWVPASDDNTGDLIKVPYRRPVWDGEIVTIAGPGWREPEDVLWVVLGTGRSGDIKVAKLGGDEGRYFPRVPRAMITPVTVDITGWVASDPDEDN